MNEAYYEYASEHPEELICIEQMKRFSREVDKGFKRRKKEKLKKLEECRRLLYGDSDTGRNG